MADIHMTNPSTQTDANVQNVNNLSVDIPTIIKPEEHALTLGERLILDDQTGEFFVQTETEHAPQHALAIVPSLECETNNIPYASSISAVYGRYIKDFIMAINTHFAVQCRNELYAAPVKQLPLVQQHLLQQAGEQTTEDYIPYIDAALDEEQYKKMATLLSDHHLDMISNSMCNNLIDILQEQQRRK